MSNYNYLGKHDSLGNAELKSVKCLSFEVAEDNQSKLIIALDHGKKFSPIAFMDGG